VEALNEEKPESARLSIKDDEWWVAFRGGPMLPIYLYGLDDCCDGDRAKVILVVRTDPSEDGMVVDGDTHRMNPDSIFVSLGAA
jgi:hypothetical protein